MKKATITRIMDNACRGESTIIGVYTYRLDWDYTRECWDIFRARTDGVGREWLTPDGQIVGAWKPLGLSDMVEAQTIARELREEGEWIPDLCEALCELACMADEYREADAEHFEAVLFKAAAILGVEII